MNEQRSARITNPTELQIAFARLAYATARAIRDASPSVTKRREMDWKLAQIQREFRTTYGIELEGGD